MAFVNEYIPEEDIKKYDIPAWNEKYLRSNFRPAWTIDRERDIYLRYMHTGREASNDQWIFCFYWKGDMLSAELQVSGENDPDGLLVKHYKLLRLMFSLFDPLPDSLCSHKSEILADLKEALIAFGDLGIHSIWTKPIRFTFDC